MKVKEFGKTGELIFELGVGTYGHGEAYGGISKQESHKVLNSCLETVQGDAKLLLDTAPRYGLGKVEEWVGEFLRKFGGEKLLVITKGGRHIDEGRVNQKDYSSGFLREDLEKVIDLLTSLGGKGDK